MRSFSIMDMIKRSQNLTIHISKEGFKHKDMIQNGELTVEFSNLFFFLPSITDRSEELNQYLDNNSSAPIDVI